MLHVRNIYMWLTVAQFRVPNRNVASNVAWSLAACAQRVASTFETAHTVLEFTDSIGWMKLDHQSYTTWEGFGVFGIRSSGSHDGSIRFSIHLEEAGWTSQGVHYNDRVITSHNPLCIYIYT